MKKALLIGMLWLTCLNVYAQSTEEFVEVIVADTIEAEPEEMVYTIYCYDDMEITETIKQAGKPGDKQKIMKSEETPAEKIRKIIKKLGTDTLPLQQYTFQSEPYGRPFKNIFYLHFTSKEKLNTFISAIQPIKDVTGFISGKKTSKMDSLHQLLTGRLLEKARKNAELIAAQSKKILGKLVQVREENNDESAGGWTVYPPLSALGQADYGNSAIILVIAKKFVVRYSW